MIDSLSLNLREGLTPWNTMWKNYKSLGYCWQVMLLKYPICFTWPHCSRFYQLYRVLVIISFKSKLKFLPDLCFISFLCVWMENDSEFIIFRLLPALTSAAWSALSEQEVELLLVLLLLQELLPVVTPQVTSWSGFQWLNMFTCNFHKWA